MRYIYYNQKGRPPATHSNNYDELLLIALSALSVSNAERRLADFFLKKHDKTVSNIDSKGSSYEVTVVENFYRLGQQNFSLHGSIAVWERKMREDRQPGRPLSIDISLFNKDRKEESRIEFGLYSKKKLIDDSKKLLDFENNYECGYEKITNFLILWSEDKNPPKPGGYSEDERKQKSLSIISKRWFEKFKEDTEKANQEIKQKNSPIEFIMSSSIDIFSENKNKENKRVVHVALFKLKPSIKYRIYSSPKNHINYLPKRKSPCPNVPT